jgi:hypothetical protein
MQGEFTFTIEKPYTETEIRDFKLFRTELKSVLKKGKLKVTEKFKVFAFVIENYTSQEKTTIDLLLKKQGQTLAVIL